MIPYSRDSRMIPYTVGIVKFSQYKTRYLAPVAFRVSKPNLPLRFFLYFPPFLPNLSFYVLRLSCKAQYFKMIQSLLLISSKPFIDFKPVIAPQPVIG